MIFVIVCSSCNTFFLFRFPSPTINALIVEYVLFVEMFRVPQLTCRVLVYPFGRLAATLLPITVYTLPKWLPGPLSGYKWSFNPCPFNVKEHALIVVMANVGVPQAYGLHLVVVSEYYYNRTFGFGFAFLLVASSQLLGFSLAGLTRRFVIAPASMIWPEALVVSANLNAFHAEEDSFQGGMPRFRFLCICIGAAVAYQWIPGKSLALLASRP
jgi:hypothetical protein